MRDIAVTLIVFGLLPVIIKRPWTGILVWTWLSMMNPHRLAWGFSRSLPLAFIVALTTLVAIWASKEHKRIPWTRESILLLVFVLWMCVTTVFSLYPDLALEQLDKVWRIQLMIFLAMMVINTRERLVALTAVVAGSIAFYGVKGGIFTIVHGGVYRVQGPENTFIGGNNEIGLAIAMIIPLVYYFARQVTLLPARWALYGATVLCAIGAIGTQSRGALLAMAAMGTMFWVKSRQKLTTMLIVAAAGYVVVNLMPEKWYERMATIETYEQDKSAQGRINAWWTALNLANDRLLGGGFETFRKDVFVRYAPDPFSHPDVHSIYFEVLGEHGWIGLTIFVLLGVFTWRSASRIRRAYQKRVDGGWLAELMAMVQVSLVAYAVGGAFLGLAYYDHYYNMVLIVVMASVIAERESKRAQVSGRSAEANPGSLPRAEGISPAAVRR